MHKSEEGLYEVEIDSQVYSFEKWGAETSLSTLLKIAKIAGKPLGLFLGSVMSGGGLSAEISPDLLANAFEALVQNMDETNCISIIKKLSCEKILCDGKKINFDLHYQDKLAHLFKVVKAALEVQYGDFLEELLGLMQVQKTVPAPKAPKIANHR